MSSTEFADFPSTDESDADVRWYPETLISHHFTPTKDAGTGKAKSAAYWLVHGSVCVGFVINTL